MVVVISAMIGQPGFAQGIKIHSALTPDPTISQQAQDNMQDYFNSVVASLTDLKATLDAEKTALVDKIISRVQERIDALDTLTVYFASEATPGAAYDEIYNFYNARLPLRTLESHEVEQLYSDKLVFFGVSSEDVEGAVQEPSGMIPAAAVQTLKDLASQDKVKGATGEQGKYRISITSVYVMPDTLDVYEGTTVIIAKDKEL